MFRFRAPMSASIVAIALLAAALAACGGPAGQNPGSGASSTATAAPERQPVLALEVKGGPAAGSYASSPASTLNICTRQEDGSWRALYAGGEPWLSLDLHVGPGIGQPGHESDVALEITAGTGYLWIDQGGFRGGDPPGRSQVAARSATASGTVTFTIDATTPNRTPGGDGAVSTIAMTLACPA